MTRALKKGSNPSKYTSFVLRKGSNPVEEHGSWLAEGFEAIEVRVSHAEDGFEPLDNYVLRVVEGFEPSKWGSCELGRVRTPERLHIIIIHIHSTRTHAAVTRP
jgi:hypothetical protein